MSTIESNVSPSSAPGQARVWRVEVHPLSPSDDPAGASVLHEIRESGLAPSITAVHTARVFLIQAPLEQEAIERIAGELLTDPVNQRYRLGATPRQENVPLIEVHYLPGVMDPVAMSTVDAIREMLGTAHGDALPAVEVRTGFRYDMEGVTSDEAQAIAQRLLANTVIQSISDLPEWPQGFITGSPYELEVAHVAMRELDDAALMQMSREAHLFLSLEEMQAIRDYYRSVDRDPTDIELETLAQTWSEHCVHKTLKSRIRYIESGEEGGGPRAAAFADRPGHSVNEDGSLTIDNLLKSTIAAATNRLMNEGVDWCVSVFKDNAGIIEFDGEDAVTFKVETHNHPSAIEPYGGAATGIGGCIRDTIGTGLAAKPFANTDIFCVADPTMNADDLPSGVLHPRRILKQVVAGVRDYGNRMGIPTVNGAVWFDDRYLGNPLVFCGSVGLIPRDKCFGDAQPGDRIIVLGGRTGRDGIHGATFSSAELTDTHADEFSHAVQIGNAITEKKTLDVILQARDHADGCLFSAITDCGAGGFSSAVGEMGEELGAFVELAKAPLKYDGLSYTEIWISEAQERMVLAVPPDKVPTLLAMAAAEDVEAFDLGYFGTDHSELILTYTGEEVGRLSMAFLHEGIPQPVREAQWRSPSPRAADRPSTSLDYAQTLHDLLAHPNIASKHWIIRQYDHEVQGGSVVKPLTGPHTDGPSDAAVIRPKLTSRMGVALSCGLCTALGDVDPYWMTLAAIDEAVRNAVCVGADPDRIAILDNFCWAKCDKPENLGSLVRAAEACYDGALAYRTPFVSGKDSLNNQFTREDGSIIEIPPTLLISAMGIVSNVERCVTMDAKAAGNILMQIGATGPQLGASHYALLTGVGGDIPRVDLSTAPHQLRTVARLIGQGHIRSAHDCSEGGLLVAAAEMAFAGRLGVELDLAGVPRRRSADDVALCFAETPTRFVVEVAAEHFHDVARALTDAGVPFGQIGKFTEGDRMTVTSPAAGQVMEASLDALRKAWQVPLDW
jgi:phosphoribosylformylglycinamidine synthase II